MKITCSEFAGRFKDPLINRALNEMWIPEFSMLFMLFTFAYLHKKNAGYPIGGSMPMSKALEKRYIALKGTVNYRKRVEKIITEGNRATGIRLTMAQNIIVQGLFPQQTDIQLSLKCLKGNIPMIKSGNSMIIGLFFTTNIIWHRG